MIEPVSKTKKLKEKAVEALQWTASCIQALQACALLRGRPAKHREGQTSE
jgi:hypothetical protein